MLKVASILAVDDETDFVDTLSSILTKYEYSVDTSCSGYEALQMLPRRTDRMRLQ